MSEVTWACSIEESLLKRHSKKTEACLEEREREGTKDSWEDKKLKIRKSFRNPCPQVALRMTRCFTQTIPLSETARRQ